MYYINGSYYPEDQARISVLDLGLLRGYGVFDYLRTYRNVPFHLQEHLLRLKYSVERIGLILPTSLKEIEGIVHTLLQQTGYAESSIKILVTGGVSPDQLLPQTPASLIVFVYPLKPFAEKCYTDGIKATTTSLARCLPEAKTLQYTPAIIALQEGRSKEAQEALYLNSKQEILEGTTCNFFAFKNDTLITADSEEVLLGITREIVLKLSKEHFNIELRSLHYEELADVQEAFFSSSNKEVMPLVQIDGHKIGQGDIGKKTRFLMQLFRDYTLQNSWKELSIPRYAQRD
jgi:branched-chain amino acid aminotransferase